MTVYTVLRNFVTSFRQSKHCVSASDRWHAGRRINRRNEMRINNSRREHLPSNNVWSGVGVLDCVSRQDLIQRICMVRWKGSIYTAAPAAQVICYVWMTTRGLTADIEVIIDDDRVSSSILTFKILDAACTSVGLIQFVPKKMIIGLSASITIEIVNLPENALGL